MFENTAITGVEVYDNGVSLPRPPSEGSSGSSEAVAPITARLLLDCMVSIPHNPLYPPLMRFRCLCNLDLECEFEIVGRTATDQADGRFMEPGACHLCATRVEGGVGRRCRATSARWCGRRGGAPSPMECAAWWAPVTGATPPAATPAGTSSTPTSPSAPPAPMRRCPPSHLDCMRAVVRLLKLLYNARFNMTSTCLRAPGEH